MFHPNLPLGRIRTGMCLLLCDDPLLDPADAIGFFHSPRVVLAVHRHCADNASFLAEGGVIIQAAGWQGVGVNSIVLDFVSRRDDRARVCFPDDRHIVQTITGWNPEEDSAIRKSILEATVRRLVVDPASGHVHDREDLSAYRLPAFWRDASVVWSALPSSWIEAPGKLSGLLIFEALGGVRAPAPAAIQASEEHFRAGTSIRLATLAWYGGTVRELGEKDALDRSMEAVLRRLIEAFGSAEALRSAALAMVDSKLDEASMAETYLAHFRTERAAVAHSIGLRGRNRF